MLIQFEYVSEKTYLPKYVWMFPRGENLVFETGELAKAVERDAFLKFYWI